MKSFYRRYEGPVCGEPPTVVSQLRPSAELRNAAALERIAAALEQIVAALEKTSEGNPL